MRPCPICRTDTANAPIGAQHCGRRQFGCPSCGGCWHEFTGPIGRRLMKRAQRRLPGVVWWTWRHAWKLAVTASRALHPLARRHLPEDLRSLTLADALRDLAWRSEQLDVERRQRKGAEADAEAHRHELVLAKIQLGIQGVPEYRRVVESLGFREETVQ